MRKSSLVYLVVAVLVVLGVIQVARPVARPTMAANVPSTQHIGGTPPSLPWPSGVQADVGASTIGGWSQHGPQSAEPIGSLAKMMTAYLVLKAHPLGLNQNGPTLLMTPQDAALYQQDAKTQQSVLPVVAGERVSELALLEGLLVPSGNNAATMLAQWVGGSVAHFTAEMNAEAKALGMRHTHFNGPVGLNGATVSTAADQMRLAEIMMKNPVIRQIVAMPEMTVAGPTPVVYNYNFLVGHGGVIGVKTGSTIRSGGCVVLAKDQTVDGHTLTVYSAVVGQPATSTNGQLWASLDAANALLQAAAKDLGNHTVVGSGETIGYLRAPWQSPIPLVAARPIQLLGWAGLSYHVHFAAHLPKVHSLPADTVVGTLTVDAGAQHVTIPIKTAVRLASPSWTYRLER